MAGALLQVLLNELEDISVPRNYMRIRLSAYDLPESSFRKLFRLSKESALSLSDKLKPFLQPSRIPLNLKVLVALRFYATGSYQGSVANDIYISLSQQSVSNCIRDVSEAISTHLMQEYIRFPRRQDLHTIKEKFYIKTGFPGVIGAIDCTHVSIVSPPARDPSGSSYINRKGFNSINVQLIVDPDLLILGISARYPGSVHDSFIWRHSVARDFISQIRDGWLLGDSGYPLEPWLMTPFINPARGSVEEGFNLKHSSARSCVERCNGVLKTRFRCLLKDRVLHYVPATAGHIINACAVLHNICVKQNIELEEECVDLTDEDIVWSSGSPADANNRAQNIRYRLALSLAR